MEEETIDEDGVVGFIVVGFIDAFQKGWEMSTGETFPHKYSEYSGLQFFVGVNSEVIFSNIWLNF